MKISEVKTLIPILMKHRVVPFLWGQQGMGKSQIVKQLAKDMGIQLIHLDLSALEPSDLIGVMVKSADGTHSTHLRPDWFPTSGKGIIFLDEFNRMHSDVMQTMMTFVTERRMHRHQLPPDWGVVAAGNYNSASFNVTDTSDAALVSRFCHLDFKPTIEEFLVYAEKSGAKDIARVIRKRPELLEVELKDNGGIFDLIKPDRRSWLEWVAPLESEPEIESFRWEVYSGLVGSLAASEYLREKDDKTEERFTGEQLLKKYPEIREKVLKCFENGENRFDIVNSAAEEMVEMLNQVTSSPEEIENVKSLLLDVPLEMSLKIFTKINNSKWLSKNDILNNKEFLNKFEQIRLKTKKETK